MNERPEGFRQSLLGLDTMVFVYHFEEQAQFGTAATQLLALARGGPCRMVTSVVALLELLVIPKRLGQDALCRAYRDFFFSLPSLSLEPVTPEIAELGADLRGRYNLATPDAIHVATAIHAGADAFVSENGRLKRRLKQIPEIPILTLAQALARVGALGSGEVHEPEAFYGAPRARRRRSFRAG